MMHVWPFFASRCGAERNRVCDEQITGVEIKRVPQMRHVFENMIFIPSIIMHDKFGRKKQRNEISTSS